MRIYPVLDIQSGIVVHAVRGERDRYQPLQSAIVDSAEPLAVARALSRSAAASTLYVADLDALSGAPPAVGVLGALVADGFRLMVDAGVRSLEDARVLGRLGIDDVVVASETLPDLETLARIVRDLGERHVVFSLDLVDGVPIGDAAGDAGRSGEEIALAAFEAGVRRMIVLDLASVGSSQGPAQQDLLRTLRQRLPGVELITGGGVRSPDDLELYRRLGIDGVLIATALHRGTLELARAQASCVVKLGGSLLDLPDLAVRLRNFLADFSRPRPVLVCGGGPTVDLIRTWDRRFHLGEEASHWIAVRALTVNAQVLARVIPGLRYTEALDDFAAIWSAGEVPVYDPYTFLRCVDEHSARPLPRRWRVTSDSIACRLAAFLGAPELILLKSSAVPPHTTCEDASRSGFVDPHFPTVATEVPRIASVDLRSGELEEILLLSPGSA